MSIPTQPGQLTHPTELFTMLYHFSLNPDTTEFVSIAERRNQTYRLISALNPNAAFKWKRCLVDHVAIAIDMMQVPEEVLEATRTLLVQLLRMNTRRYPEGNDAEALVIGTIMCAAGQVLRSRDDKVLLAVMGVRLSNYVQWRWGNVGWMRVMEMTKVVVGALRVDLPLPEGDDALVDVLNATKGRVPFGFPKPFHECVDGEFHLCHMQATPGIDSPQPTDGMPIPTWTAQDHEIGQRNLEFDADSDKSYDSAYDSSDNEDCSSPPADLEARFQPHTSLPGILISNDDPRPTPSPEQQYSDWRYLTVPPRRAKRPAGLWGLGSHGEAARATIGRVRELLGPPPHREREGKLPEAGKKRVPACKAASEGFRKAIKTRNRNARKENIEVAEEAWDIEVQEEVESMVDIRFRCPSHSLPELGPDAVGSLPWTSTGLLGLPSFEAAPRPTGEGEETSTDLETTVDSLGIIHHRNSMLSFPSSITVGVLSRSSSDAPEHGLPLVKLPTEMSPLNVLHRFNGPTTPSPVLDDDGLVDGDGGYECRYETVEEYGLAIAARAAAALSTMPVTVAEALQGYERELPLIMRGLEVEVVEVDVPAEVQVKVKKRRSWTLRIMKGLERLFATRKWKGMKRAERERKEEEDRAAREEEQERLALEKEEKRKAEVERLRKLREWKAPAYFDWVP